MSEEELKMMVNSIDDDTTLSDVYRQAIENIKLARKLLEKVGNLVNPAKSQELYDSIILLIKSSESVVEEYDLFIRHILKGGSYISLESLSRVEFLGNVWNGDMYGVDKKEAVIELLKDLKSDYDQLTNFNIF